MTNPSVVWIMMWERQWSRCQNC